jgi:hypothetical protein
MSADPNPHVLHTIGTDPRGKFDRYKGIIDKGVTPSGGTNIQTMRDLGDIDFRIHHTTDEEQIVRETDIRAATRKTN